MGPWVGGRAAGPAAPPGLLTQQAASQPAFPQNTAVGAATRVVPTSHAELSSTRRKQVVDPLLFAHPQPMCPADVRREPRQRPPLIGGVLGGTEDPAGGADRDSQPRENSADRPAADPSRVEFTALHGMESTKEDTQ